MRKKDTAAQMADQQKYPWTASIRMRIFFGMLGLTILLVLVINGLVCKQYITDMENQAVSYADDTVRKMAESMSDTAAALEENMTYKITHADIFGYQKNLKNAVAFSVEQNMQTFAELMKSGAFQIHTVYIRDRYHCSFYWNRDTLSHDEVRSFKKTEAGQYIEEHYEELKSRRGTTLWRRFADAPDDIYLIKTVLNWDTLAYEGILCVVIDNCYMAEIEKNLSFCMAVYDENGALLYSGSELTESALQYGAERLEQKEDAKAEGYLNVQATVPKRGWTVAGFISEKELRSGMMDMLRRMFLLELVFMILSAVVAACLSKSMTGNISALIANFRRISRGEEAEDIRYVSGDETAYLCEKFNDMNHQLKAAVAQMASDRTQKERAEYNALTAQMNPHFLYNTLESINALAKLHQEPEIAEAVGQLAKLLRAALSGRDPEIPLKQELDYARQYLELQKLISGRLEWDIVADAELLDCRVPKLILQPLVENSMLHGFAGMMETPMVVIVVREQEGKLELEICDNGQGMEQEFADRLLSEEEPPELRNDRSHIGVRSILRRIRYLYGEDYGLKITGSPGEGTVICLTLPICRDAGNSLC